MLLLDGDHGNLNARMFYQSRCLNPGTGGLRIRHDFLVHFVHVPKLLNICQIDGHGDDVGHFESRGLKHFLNIFKRRFRLGRNPAAEGKALAAGKIDVLVPLDVAVRTGDSSPCEDDEYGDGARVSNSIVQCFELVFSVS